MLKISKDGVSVIAVLDRRRAKKSGVFPVKIEVVYNRIQKYYQQESISLPKSGNGYPTLSACPIATLTSSRNSIR